MLLINHTVRCYVLLINVSCFAVDSPANRTVGINRRSIALKCSWHSIADMFLSRSETQYVFRTCNDLTTLGMTLAQSAMWLSYYIARIGLDSRRGSLWSFSSWKRKANQQTLSPTSNTFVFSRSGPKFSCKSHISARELIKHTHTTDTCRNVENTR